MKEKVKKGGWKRTKFLLVHFLDGRQKLVRICAGVVVGSVATFLSPVTPAVCDSPNIALAVFCIVTAASRGSSFSSQPTYLPTFNNVLPHHNCHTYPLRELPSNLLHLGRFKSTLQYKLVYTSVVKVSGLKGKIQLFNTRTEQWKKCFC